MDAQQLDSLGAQAVILGATVQNTSAGEQINSSVTQSIELDNATVALTGPEIILAAQNDVTLDQGALISASGTLNRQASTIVVQGAGALLRASSGSSSPLVVDSTVAQNPAGNLSIGSAASVKATGSLLLYSSGNTGAAPDATISAPGLGLYSSRISMGDVPTGSGPAAPTGGLNLTSQLLSQLSGLTDLTIGSTSTIDFYGAVSIGGTGSASPNLHSITLDAWAVDGYGAGDKVLQAGVITLANYNQTATSSTPPAGLFVNNAPAGTGSLTLRAPENSAPGSGEIVLGVGSKQLNGFTARNARRRWHNSRAGSWVLDRGGCGRCCRKPDVAGFGAYRGKRLQPVHHHGGAVTILPSGAANAAAPVAPLGGQLDITGASVAQNGTIELPAGVISLQATNGSVILGGGSVTSAAGSAQNFVVTDAVAPGGQISLISAGGDVKVDGGATVDVSGATSSDGKTSGAAGSLTVSAAQGTFSYDGATIKGGAPNRTVTGKLHVGCRSFRQWWILRPRHHAIEQRFQRRPRPPDAYGRREHHGYDRSEQLRTFHRRVRVHRRCRHNQYQRR